VLTGAAVGSLAAALAALGLWWLRAPLPRASAFGLMPLGAALGFVWARRRRWSDRDVALFVDARLGSNELLSTAVDLRRSGRSGENGEAAQPESDSHSAGRAVLQRASELLDTLDPRRARPRLLLRLHALAPAGAMLSAALLMAPLPPPPPAPPVPTGAQLVRLSDLSALDAAVALDRVDPRDAGQDKRLRELAERARKLRDELRRGMPLREAQAEVARLREDIAAERLKLTDQASRPGLEAALAELEKNSALDRPRTLLGNGDLTEFDGAMRELANRVEERDRDQALESLAKAARAAGAKGNRALEQLLEAERKLFEERSSKSLALRELARALGDKLGQDGQRALGELSKSGSPEAAAALGKALADALEKMSPEERRRLAENLAQRMQGKAGDGQAMTRAELEELAKRLRTPEGRAELRKTLEDLARLDPSDAARREQSLGEAERGGAEAERRLRALPVPIGPSAGGNRAGTGSPAAGGSASPKAGGSGHSEDIGKGDHAGTTAPVPGDQLRAKARTHLGPGPMHVTAEGRAPARPGETANEQGTGALERAAPDQVGAVERSEVPEEYREQVGRYFQP
jgi:hypothetical protein